MTDEKMPVSKPETLRELRERLDAELPNHPCNHSCCFPTDEWPRISKALEQGEENSRLYMLRWARRGKG